MRGTRFDLLKSFFGDERGNIAVIFAIACIPLLAAVGCAVDYSLATRIKADRQHLPADIVGPPQVERNHAGTDRSVRIAVDGRFESVASADI